MSIESQADLDGIQRVGRVATVLQFLLSELLGNGLIPKAEDRVALP